MCGARDFYRKTERKFPINEPWTCQHHKSFITRYFAINFSQIDFIKVTEGLENNFIVKRKFLIKENRRFSRNFCEELEITKIKELTKHFIKR